MKEYVEVPKSITEDRRLNGVELGVMVVILNKSKGSSVVNNKELKAKVHLSANRYKTTIKRLCDLKYIKKINGGRNFKIASKYE